MRTPATWLLGMATVWVGVHLVAEERVWVFVFLERAGVEPRLQGLLTFFVLLASVGVAWLDERAYRSSPGS